MPGHRLAFDEVADPEAIPGIIRLGPEGEIDTLDPGTPEEHALAEDIQDLVRALAQQAARQDYARVLDEARSAAAGASEAAGAIEQRLSQT